MQVPPAKCYERGCKHWDGWKSFSDKDIRNVCKAFPKGIPDNIAFGTHKHLKPVKGQVGDTVFERQSS